MKPTKNQFFCPDCGKVKMRFETEAKANRFLMYNAEEIELETGVRPERSYYCLACNSWHITSQKVARNVKSRTEVALEKFYKLKELKQNTKLTRIKIVQKLPEPKAKPKVEPKVEPKVAKASVASIASAQKKEIHAQTKEIREELAILFKTLEKELENVKIFRNFMEIEECIKICQDSDSMLNKIKIIISQLDSCYENILHQIEIQKMFVNIHKKYLILETELNFLKNELDNSTLHEDFL